MFPNDYEVEIRSVLDVGTRWHPILFHLASYVPTQHGIAAVYTLFYLDPDGNITAAPQGAKVRPRDTQLSARQT